MFDGENGVARLHQALDQRYLIYTKWCIPHCRQAKIEARSKALVVPTELTRSIIICVFCNAEMDKVDDKSSNAEKYSVFCSILLMSGNDQYGRRLLL